MMLTVPIAVLSGQRSLALVLFVIGIAVLVSGP